MRSGSPAITVEFWLAGVGGVSDRPVLCDKGYNERQDTEVIVRRPNLLFAVVKVVGV